MTRNRRFAFTLIELLVVVAIIAVLMAIMLPSLSRAREQAKTAACLSNQRQIGLAITMYATEYNGVIVPMSYKYNAAPLFTSNSLGGQECWATILQYAGYAPKAGESQMGYSGHYPPFFTRSMFYCPGGLVDSGGRADISEAVAPVTPEDPNAQRPIVWKSTVLQSPAHVWYGVNGRTWSVNSAGGSTGSPVHVAPMHRIPDDNFAGDWWLAKIAAIPSTSQMVMAFDGWQWNLSATGTGLARLAARHMNNTVTNVVMFDGHAESIRRNKMPPVGTESNFVSSNPTWLNQNYPYPLWRMDQGQ